MILRVVCEHTVDLQHILNNLTSQGSNYSFNLCLYSLFQVKKVGNTKNLSGFVQSKYLLTEYMC